MPSRKAYEGRAVLPGALGVEQFTAPGCGCSSAYASTSVDGVSCRVEGESAPRETTPRRLPHRCRRSASAAPSSIQHLRRHTGHGRDRERSLGDAVEGEGHRLGPGREGDHRVLGVSDRAGRACHQPGCRSSRSWRRPGSGRWAGTSRSNRWPGRRWRTRAGGVASDGLGPERVGPWTVTMLMRSPCRGSGQGGGDRPAAPAAPMVSS